MAVTVLLRTYRGVVERLGSAPMEALLAAAKRSERPLLMGVDEFDDTVFNQRQCETVLREVDLLVREYPELDGAAVEELRAMATEVLRRPHRYLVFNGD